MLFDPFFPVLLDCPDRSPIRLNKGNILNLKIIQFYVCVDNKHKTKTSKGRRFNKLWYIYLRNHAAIKMMVTRPFNEKISFFKAENKIYCALKLYKAYKSFF